MNRITKYKNYYALESDVIIAVEHEIENGSSPESAYKNGLTILAHKDLLVEKAPHGVTGFGGSKEFHQRLDNRMRELGHATVVEPKGPRARVEISW